MSALANGEVSDGNRSKRLLENGYHSLNSENATKFKVRKVSATRDFPHMCGHDYLVVKSEMKGNVTPEVGGNHAMLKTDASQELANFDLPQDAEINGVVASASESTVTKNETDVKVLSHEDLESSVGEDGSKSLDMFSERVDAGDVHDMVAVTHQMVLHFKYMESESLKDHESKSVDMEFAKDGNVKETKASANQLRNGEVAAFVKHLDEDVVKASGEVGRLIQGKISVPSPKNKFHRRRISATRDFPLYCGVTSAPPIDHNERLKFTSGEPLCGVSDANEEKGVEALKSGADTTSSLERRTKMVEEYPSGKLGTTAEVGDPVLSMSSGYAIERGEPRNSDLNVTEPVGTVSSQKNPQDTVVADGDEKDQSLSSSQMGSLGHAHRTNRRATGDIVFSGQDDNHVIVNALVAAKHCPWRQDKSTAISGGLMFGSHSNKMKTARGSKSKAVAKKKMVKVHSKPPLKKKAISPCKHSVDGPGAIYLQDEGESGSESEFPLPSVDVTLPPFGPSSDTGNARNKVREILRLFQTLCRKLLHGEESRPDMPKIKRIDLVATKIMKKKGKEVNTDRHYVGPVPGVEVGDEFQYRVELAIVGIHRLYQAGIDSMIFEGKKVATSIVASGGYDDDMENPDVLIYSGQGGLKVKDKEPQDQKLEKGNLALFNSISTRNPIRVIRGSKEKDIDSQDSRGKLVTKYVYDGLYTAENFWKETGSHGKSVFMFKLIRMPGQPELAWKEVKKSKKSRTRHGVLVDDISGGKEPFPISAMNTIDNETPQPFYYIKKVRYPDSLYLRPAKGCDCVGRCSDSRKCSCALRNGGQIPYNHNGAIVEAKTLVYECGPHCKCPPSCFNRVSQHGIKLPLEVFKTKSRGWGVRSLSSISSGSFICEYVGEIIEDKEAEKRVNDEYLFDIGQNYTDCSLNPDGSESSDQAVEEGGDGYTIDAVEFGNVGRFINHSCSPNLYAQNVLYDHDDKRVPHIMLFAAENIPPLHELTYHYNYVVDQVHDSEGNIKVKSCYCGASDCTGRMY
ncbi:OLC1v1031617C1 [Oldenlandia corymbosa var. corymbosa]|uniref:OLC1v1031617C1 n=1 Tax=Oldenlandia corymbosa var. corymbosa TaxID=529605 RepID=A0AAV1CKI1_OLDCO|nr:OLC1v1031617C1 [Oldenlandia corymbosa var. corymbosa]